MDKDAYFWQVADGRLPPPRVAQTLGMKTFLRPAEPGKLRGVGRVVRRGKDVCYLAGELFQNGDLVATATVTALVRSK